MKRANGTARTPSGSARPKLAPRLEPRYAKRPAIPTGYLPAAFLLAGLWNRAAGRGGPGSFPCLRFYDGSVGLRPDLQPRPRQAMVRIHARRDNPCSRKDSTSPNPTLGSRVSWHVLPGHGDPPGLPPPGVHSEGSVSCEGARGL